MTAPIKDEGFHRSQTYKIYPSGANAEWGRRGCGVMTFCKQKAAIWRLFVTFWHCAVFIVY